MLGEQQRCAPPQVCRPRLARCWYKAGCLQPRASPSAALQGVRSNVDLTRHGPSSGNQMAALLLVPGCRTRMRTARTRGRRRRQSPSAQRAKRAARRRPPTRRRSPRSANSSRQAGGMNGGAPLAAPGQAWRGGAVVQLSCSVRRCMRGTLNACGWCSGNSFCWAVRAAVPMLAVAAPCL